MKNILTINNGIAILLSNVDDGTNAIIINGDEIPSTEWTGTGNYTYIDSGVTFTIQKIADDTGNIMLQLVSGTTYRLVKYKAANINNAYLIDDPAENTLADGDYIPFYDTSASEKKKTLLSTIVDFIKSALGISSSGSTFLRKDGTWGTPANTTYTFATGDSNGQIKVTPSGGSAQNIDVKGLGSNAYTSTSFLPLAGGTVTGTLILSRTQDASGTADNKPALIIGGTDSQAHIEIDSNEVMAKASGTTTAALYINSDGGLVYANGLLVARCTSAPTSGQVMVSDGTEGKIKSSGYSIAKSVPSNAVFTDTTYGAARGLALSNANNFYIRNWLTMTATAVNSSANVTLRYMSGIALAYQTYFSVNKSTAASPQDFTVEGTKYRYAPLFSLTATDAGNLVSNTDNLPADGAVVSLFRHINAATGSNTVIIRLGRKGSTYYIIDDSIRTATLTAAAINAVINANTWHYKTPGVLFFLYNN